MFSETQFKPSGAAGADASTSTVETPTHESSEPEAQQPAEGAPIAPNEAQESTPEPANAKNGARHDAGPAVHFRGGLADRSGRAS